MALSLLKQVKAKRSNLEGTLEYEWGSSKVLQQTDLRQLSRAQLRNHLEARDLDTEGPKTALIARLEGSLEEEKLQSIAYTEQLEAEFQINKDLEERGAVYAVGANYSGQVRARAPSHRAHACRRAGASSRARRRRTVSLRVIRPACGSSAKATTSRGACSRLCRRRAAWASPSSAFRPTWRSR